MHINQHPQDMPTTIDSPPVVALSSTSKATVASPNSHSAANNLKSTNSIGTGKSKDIIIGMAQDTDPKNLAVFCGSLRRVSDADVVIFINAPVPERHREIAGKYNIQLIDFDLSSLDESIRKYHPSTLRWPLIYNFFKDSAIQSKYNRVWMIDVRDSAFQKDPFVMLPAGESAFYAFGGVEDKLIADCGWNAGWIRDCFGEQTLNEVGSNAIICSGVSVASMDRAIPYLQLMSDTVLGKDKFAKFPSCERNGVDQGAHNVIIHKQLIDNLRIWKQRDSQVANMQAKIARVQEIRNELNEVADMRVYNGRNELVAVVHQYDRDSALQSSLFKQVTYSPIDSCIDYWGNSCNYDNN